VSKSARKKIQKNMTKRTIGGTARPDKRVEPRAQHTSNIEIGEYGISGDGQQFVRVVIRAPQNKKKVALLPLNDIGAHNAAIFADLNRKGAHLITPAARNEFLNRIQAKGYAEPAFEVVTKIGWHNGAFVLPRRVFSEVPAQFERYLISHRDDRLSKYRVKGKLSGWQEIARLAIGNSRLMLALALAFVGPVGPILEVEQVGIQLFGPQGCGKTATLIAAGSVWGRHVDPDSAASVGFGSSWNTTTNDSEQESLGSNHALQAMDETRSATTELRRLGPHMFDNIMRWERGIEKGRLGEMWRRRAWWCALLSTSNLSLLEMVEAAHSTPVDDALLSRLIDVPPPAGGFGIFQNLHGKSSVAEFSQRIIAISRQHFGWPSRVFIDKLVKWRARDECGLEAWLAERREFYLTKANRISSPNRDLNRIHGKFATIYAAGCLAIEFDILPWERLQPALLSTEWDHVRYVEQMRANAVQAQLAPTDRLRAYVRQHRKEFVDLQKRLIPKPSSHDHEGCSGYINQHADQGLEYLFADRKLEEVVGGPVFARRCKAELAANGMIATAAGSDGDRFSVKRAIGRVKGKLIRRHVIAVRALALDQHQD
jgi:putative DNA primase/helicase